MNDHNHKESLCWLTLFNADIIKESCFAQVDQHSACFNHQMVILAFVPVSGYFSDICCFVNTILVPQCLSYRVFSIRVVRKHSLQLPTVAALRAYTFGSLQTGDKNRHSVSH